MKSDSVMLTFLEEVVVKGRLELIDSLAHEDMVDEANVMFGGPPGRAGLVAHVKGFHRNIADAEVTIKRIVAGDQDVMAWWSFAGIHAGPWLGKTPTHRPVNASVFSCFDLAEGRIARYKLFVHAEFPESVVLDTSLAEFG